MRRPAKIHRKGKKNVTRITFKVKSKDISLETKAKIIYTLMSQLLGTDVKIG